MLKTQSLDCYYCRSLGIRIYTRPNYDNGVISIKQPTTIDCCQCYHGTFVRNYYKFTPVIIDSASLSETKELIVTIDNVEYTMSEIMHKHIQKFLE